jgi:hypothetical protein
MNKKIQESLSASGQIKKVNSYTLASGDKQTDITIRFVGAEETNANYFNQIQAGALVEINYDPNKN